MRTPRRSLLVRVLLLAPLLMSLTACARCVPDLVGAGAARLSVRNLGALASALNADSNCGFANADVIANAAVDSGIGGEGGAVFTVENCVLDFGEETLLSEDCRGNKRTASGKVTVSATRTLTGWLSGDANSPVVPMGPDAVVISIDEASFESFVVRDSQSENAMTIVSGTASAKVQPLLAASLSSGVCSIATPNARVFDVSYGESVVVIHQGETNLDVEINASSYEAVNGTVGDKENYIDGTITVFGGEVSASGADGPNLDPDYDAATFAESFVCTDDLSSPVSFECVDVGAVLAGGAARLTVKSFGNVAKLVDGNTDCGFSSEAVQSAVVVDGTLGHDEGTAVFEIASPCTIALDEEIVLATDCNGLETRVSGSVTVTGTKTLHGFVSGDPTAPIVPTSPEPAEIDLSITFDELRVSDNAGGSYMTIHEGTASGRMYPRTGMDQETYACSISTPVVRFENLSYNLASATLVSGTQGFELPPLDGTVSAQTGVVGDVENALTGSSTMNDVAYAFPADLVGEGLDPAFDVAAFASTYTCTENLFIVSDDATCSFRFPLGLGASRLFARLARAIHIAAESNATCGFAPNVGTPEVTGDVGGPGEATWTVTSCAETYDNAILREDCVGTRLVVDGGLTFSGTRTLSGTRVDEADGWVVPDTREANVFAYTSVGLDGFSAWLLKEGETEPASKVTFTGDLSLVVKPIGGESATNPGVYSAATEVMNITEIVGDGEVTIYSAGKTFVLEVEDAELRAIYGNWGVEGNLAGGSVVLDGEHVEIIPHFDLIEDYDQAAFDATYDCYADLKEPIP